MCPGSQTLSCRWRAWSVAIQGTDPAICISSLKIDLSFTYLCPFVRPKPFRYELVVIQGNWSSFRVNIEDKKTFKKHLAISSGGSGRVEFQFSFRNLGGRLQNWVRVLIPSRKCLAEVPQM
jgi:hypothetical protein